jgi:hypothetical protein
MKRVRVSTVAVSVKYSEYVVSVLALVVRHAKRMRLIIVSSVACLALSYFFPHYLINGRFSEKILNIKCVLSLQALSETLPILIRIQRDIIINIHRSSYTVRRYALFFSDFNEAWIFSTDFWKPSNIKFHENPSSGSRVVPCGQTDWRS